MENPSILSHVSLGSNRFSEALAFYDRVLATLGIGRILDLSEHQAVAYGRIYPEFWIQAPFDGQPAQSANGVHIAFLAKDREQVHAFYEAALAAGGKEVRKKNLAEIAMGYGYIYVAMVAMGADYNQCVKAIAEAEAYPGPSLIIGYAPCIAHGIKGGMRVSMTQEKKAVQSGYWSLFRYNPLLAEEGKNPFTMDSKEPTISYREFIETEVRYNRLLRSNPEKAEELFKRSEAEAKFRLETFKRRTVWNVGE